jgi:hypothetical protein
MIIPLKSEPNSDHLSFACPPSLKAKIQEYAAKNIVTESAAARHILSLFFDNDCNFIGKQSNETQKISSKKGARRTKVVAP